ncbi:MAG: molecular chaperone DnaJ [Sandaracinobacter sp.]
MALVALLAVGLLGWLWWSGHLGADAGRKLAVAAGAGMTLWMLGRGQTVPGLAMGGVTAALAYAGWMRAKVAVRPMDEIEARQLLSVGLHADADEINAAHRRLIGQVHPDKGGSAELARRVNAARDLLLARLQPRV